MNVHILIDRLVSYIGAVLSINKGFFSESTESEGFPECLKKIELEIPDISKGLHELTARTPAGEMAPAFYITRLKGKDHPTIIYHHGNNERPFDFGRFSKNTFKNILADSRHPVQANIIAVRAPFHNSSTKEYLEKIKHLSNFVMMNAVSVKLVEKLVQSLRKDFRPPVLVSGISLGGWVTNLHRAYFNTADIYAPLLAGAALGEVFITSEYRRMAGKPAKERSEVLREVLNFEEDFMKVLEDNVFPLLGRFDQYIEYDRQKVCYGGRDVNVLDRGHVTSAMDAGALRRHLLNCLREFESKETPTPEAGV